MPPRWSSDELDRLAVRLYEHVVRGKRWKEIAQEEAARRQLGDHAVDSESIMKATSRYARRIGVSIKRAVRPAND